MRYYSSTAIETALAGNVTGSSTTLNVTSVSGFPIQYPYTLSIDADNGSKELVDVTDAVGTTLTVVRGVDGTTGVEHALGAVVSHDHSARDFRESRTHEASTAAHGVSGDVVGTTDVQVITNKDFSSGTNAWPATGAIPDTGWLDATPLLTAGVQAYIGTTPKYRRLGPMVFLRMALYNTTGTQQLFRLPEGFRPSATQSLFITATNQAAEVWYASVVPSGYVNTVRSAGGTYGVDTCFLVD